MKECFLRILRMLELVGEILEFAVAFVEDAARLSQQLN